MAITSSEVAEILGFTTASVKITQIEAILPYMQVYVNDYCGGVFSRQIKEESVTFTAAATAGAKQLTGYPIVRGSVRVESTARSEEFYGDTQFGEVPSPTYYIPSTYVRDFEIEYSTGAIYIPTTDSQIGSTESVLVSYSFIDMPSGAKLAVSRLVDQAMNQTAGIASESVGTLARSYYGNSGTGSGIDPLVKSMLAPYRRARVI